MERTGSVTGQPAFPNRSTYNNVHQAFGNDEEGVGLLVAFIQAGFTIIFAVMLARIYVQLSGPGHAGVSVPSSGT